MMKVSSILSSFGLLSCLNLILGAPTFKTEEIILTESAQGSYDLSAVIPSMPREGPFVKLSINGMGYWDASHSHNTDGKKDKTKIAEVLIETPVGSCGGTIVGEKFILTAAHCFVDKGLCDEKDESKYKAALPSADKIHVFIEGTCHPYESQTCPPEDESHEVKAQKVYILEQYFKTNCDHGDLAMVELAVPVGDHGSRLSTDPKLPTSGDFQVSGFGFDPIELKATEHLLKTVRLTAKECGEDDKASDAICTVEVDKDVCEGDSGGALQDHKGVIFGVVSYGMDCSSIYSSLMNKKAAGLALKQWDGGVFTAVASHLSFICQIIGKHQDCPETPVNPAETYMTI